MKADPQATSTNTPESGNGSPRTGSPTTENVAEAAHSAVDRVADNAARAEQHVREKAAEGERQLREKSLEARHATERAIDQARQYAQEKPFAAAAIAFAAGLIVSRILGK